MAKSIKIRRTVIGCPYFEGYLEEMPQDVKDKIKAEKPELFKQIFKKL